MPGPLESASDVMEIYRAAINSDPMNYWSWYHLCVKLVGQNQIDEAIALCKSGTIEFPKSPSPLLMLSGLYAAKGNYTEAISTSMQWFTFKPAILWLALECEDPWTPHDPEIMKELE